MTHYTYNIHGDNIVECERTLSLIVSAFGQETSVEFPQGTAFCPVFIVHSKKHGDFKFSFYPGFGRWDDDVLAYIKSNGGVLREAPDVIITRVVNGNQEIPVFAMEYSGALPAGNQAWQRSGRAFSSGQAHVRYLYIAEIGGYELDKNRKNKSTRYPNPIVPFSYYSYSRLMNTLVLPIFLKNPAISNEIKEKLDTIFGNEVLLSVIKNVLLNKDIKIEYEILKSKTLSFVKALAANKSNRFNWQQFIDKVENNESIINYIMTAPKILWKKTAYITGLTKTVRKLMYITSKYALGITSNKLPFCLIPADNRKKYFLEVCDLYPNLTSEFQQWLNIEKPLVICWIMGFKPKGDDARPDRGLTSLARMLVGNNVDMLTVIYGPAKTSVWTMFKKYPEQLIAQNGLWESILMLSDSVLIDAITDKGITDKGYTNKHWRNNTNLPKKEKLFVTPWPIKKTENDVDTALHILFQKFGNEYVFEGLCNPPGGDWSGLSLLANNKNTELRWLSLPRVSGSATKRPDHVLQLFGILTRPIILSIESKENSSAIENNIGERLNNYIKTLLKSRANVESDNDNIGINRLWIKAKDSINVDNVHCASAVAFLSKDDDLKVVSKKTNCDIIIGISIDIPTNKCKLLLYSNSDIGRKIECFIRRIIGKTNMFII
ncbi:hypothetical protein NO2_0358 [Candidatus Termititenax persephonae]|uniref:Uncharacterized protein n=1 Tax=Candidatus Termititenax persephonae TaxID=2218525 RepID=A0A388TF86_9BACT|nr:hypothetical protein NO2_0358 [Candidatus Termititenax persephonae]